MSADNSLGIYIHIPFCRSKCLYCDFYSLPLVRAEGIAEYVSALCDHIEQIGSSARGRSVDTVFIGGGTPTVLSLAHFEQIMETLVKNFSVKCGAEITVEANPATFDTEKLTGLRELGVNRLSIGMQSANGNELKLLGRAHGFSEIENAVDMVNRAGFDNFNLDIMYGIPDQTWGSFANTLECVKKLSPAHVSVYGLQLEEGTPLFECRKKYIFPTEDEERELNRLALTVLENAGYHRYEISNYAVNGYECRHNLRYWKQGEYIGIGAAAHSYFKGIRYGAPEDINVYKDAVKHRDLAVLRRGEQAIDLSEYKSEYIMLRMRLSEGISPSEFKSETGEEFTEYEKRIAPFMRTGHIRLRDGRYTFTPDGFDVSNYILSHLL